MRCNVMHVKNCVTYQDTTSDSTDECEMVPFCLHVFFEVVDPQKACNTAPAAGDKWSPRLSETKLRV